MIRRKDSSVLGPDADRTRCLAKTERSEADTVPGMTVWEHSLLTGLIAGILGRCFRHLSAEGMFPDGFELVAAIHDIGKISPLFQERIALALDGRCESELASLHCPELGHTAVGEAFASESLGRDDIAHIIAFHHGASCPLKYSEADPVFGGDEWSDERLEFFREMSDFLGTDLPGMLTHQQRDLLTGLTVVSDWISSSVDLSEFRAVTPAIAAAEAVMKTGFTTPLIRRGLSFSDIFQFRPNGMQKGFISSLDGPGLYVLEAGMGEGKTEAALYAAYRLLEEGEADGIYFAFPTRLTSSAMMGRMNRFLNAISEEEAHAERVFGGAHLCGEEKECWFSGYRRRLLAPYGAGTVDQALFSVINCRFRELRTFALAGKVVIVDELHSYDFYTGRLIGLLIEEVLKLGSTVIVLSATLCGDATRGLPGYPKTADAFPLVSGVSRKGRFSFPLEGRSPRKVIIEHLDEDAALEKAVRKVEEGAKVLWIENTVRDAQRISRKIRKMSGIRTGLVHSAFTWGDRRKIEEEWMEEYVRRKADGRGAVLVGTQVLEQSLDIDADLLVSRMAPMDMQLQRIGRLWRHTENDAVRGTDEALCIILSARTGRGFGASSHVYSPYVLLRTEEALAGRRSIIIPDDMRSLLSKVYSERKPETEEESRYLLSLEKEKEEMSRAAACAVMEAGRTVSDIEAMTRLSDEAYVDMLIVREYGPEKGRMVLLDGTELKLCGAGNRKAVTGALEDSMLSIRRSAAPDRVLPYEEMRIFMPYLHVSEKAEFRMRIAVSDGSGKLTDVRGNVYAGISYTALSGYEICREEGSDGE